MESRINDAVTRAKKSLRSIKHSTLVGLQRSLHYTGAARLDKRLAPCEGFLTLMYHSVPDLLKARFVNPQWAIPPDVFDKQLSLLKQRCNVVSLAQAVAWMQSKGSLPGRAVVLTFDDGYLDNLEVAAPLLRWHRLPATVFVATGYVDRQEPQWADELHCMLAYRQSQKVQLSAVPQAFDLSTEQGERAAAGIWAGMLLSGNAEFRRKLLNELKAGLEPNRTVPRLTLSWEHLRTLHRIYPEIELGLHSHDHLDLAALPLEAAVAEIQHSQSRFEAEMGFKARSMSFPYGRSTPALAARLPELGIDAAFTTQPTQRTLIGHNPWSMSRYEVNCSMTDFRLWSEGAMPDLGKLVFGRVADQT